jgi:hypothetical protein
LKKFVWLVLLALFTLLCFAEEGMDGYAVEGSLFGHWKGKRSFEEFDKATDYFTHTVPASPTDGPLAERAKITSMVEKLKALQVFEPGDVWDYMYFTDVSSYIIWFYKDSEQGLLVRVYSNY